MRFQENDALYRKRLENNEHIFANIKRQRGYNHINLNGLEKVGGEYALILLVYNKNRSMNFLGDPDLIEKQTPVNKRWWISREILALFF